MLCTADTDVCQWIKSPAAVNKELALNNIEKLAEKISELSDLFVTHDNFDWCPSANEWYNNPEGDEVPDGYFKQLCDLYLGDISLQAFVTELRWEDYRERFDSFTRKCLSHFGDISWYDVYWAYRKTARLLQLIDPNLTRMRVRMA